MRYVVGIDLGSTTTKAVVLGEDGQVLGRGITNSRSNYQVACDVALGEALINTRFGLVAAGLDEAGLEAGARASALASLERGFREQQYRLKLRVFREIARRHAEAPGRGSGLLDTLDAILDEMEREAAKLFAVGSTRKSDFFRDLASSRYLELAEQRAAADGALFDHLASLFDKSILEVENRPVEGDEFSTLARAALRAMDSAPTALGPSVERAAQVVLEPAGSVGTGYGRQALPFPKEQIRSEILCHGLGAHYLFPGTRTVLDIGGQDTKAIQVDDRGNVTSFQMNDRCAAGCGR
jgi:benzoyl-CoA reductase subunit A